MNQVTQINNLATNNMVDKAVVKAVNDKLFLVNSQQGIQNAKLAVSCLIAPEQGDSVMICILNDECFITAVLEKKNPVHQINISGDLEFNTTGQTTFKSTKGINHVSENEISVTANKIKQVSVEQKVVCNDLNMQVQEGKVQAKNLQLNAEQTNTVVSRCYHRAEQAFRWVETIETLNIGNWVQNIKQTLTSRSKNTVFTAKQDMKIDGDRIHMG